MALKINRSSCVHKAFTMRFTVHFALSFVLCIFSPFTTHKPSPNSVQGASTKCLLKSALIVPLVSFTLEFVFWVRSPFTTHLDKPSQILFRVHALNIHSKVHSPLKKESRRLLVTKITFFFYFKHVSYSLSISSL